MALFAVLVFVLVGVLSPWECLAKDDDAAATVRPVTQYNETHQKWIIQTLQDRRWKVKPAPDLKFMQNLTWNDELASLAQAQADRCTYELGYPDWWESLSILASHPGRRIGATTWTGWNSSWLVNYWNKEGRYHFDYCTNECTYDRKALKAKGYYRSSEMYYYRGCVNYTQMVWGDSRHVGCGHRRCGFENYHFKPGNDHHICYFFPGAVTDFDESERMNNLPYKTLLSMNETCNDADSIYSSAAARVAVAAVATTIYIFRSRH